MILHIPHSSTRLPKDFTVSDETDLQQEFRRMTDWFTDELFDVDEATKIIFPYSRLYCDVERFREDEDESMAKKGMGVCYVTNSFGKKLRDVTENEKEFIKSNFYDKHHADFLHSVENELRLNAKAFIVDCHSFSNEVLPHEESIQRPDFCIGVDKFHTPKKLVDIVEQYLRDEGFSVMINQPFEGTIVPLKFYQKEKKVTSIMIEINRNLYLDESFQKNKNFQKMKNVTNTLLNFINTFTNFHP